MAIQFNGSITPSKSQGTKEVIDGSGIGSPLVPQASTTPTSEPIKPAGLNPICIGPPPGVGYVCVAHPDSVADPITGAVKGMWVFQGTPTPTPPPIDCRLSAHGLALGETPISLNGSITEHFNGTFQPTLHIVQSDGLHRTEAARRLSAADPINTWIFVNTGEKLKDKCFALSTNKTKIRIPNTNEIAFISYFFPELNEFLYIGDDMSLYRLERKGESPPPPPGGGLGVGKIYTKLGMGDIIGTHLEPYTEGMWSGNIGNLLTFFTSSNQNTGSRLYNLEVRDKVDTDCKSEVQFSIAYGHADGSGSYDLGGYDYITPSNAVYGQYKGLCLEQSESYFNIDNETVKSIYAVNVRRSRMRDRMDEGNWEMNLHHLSGSQFTAGGGARNAYTGSNIQLGTDGAILRLIDDSKINSGSVTSAGSVYRVVSGSIENGVYTPASPTVYGLSYPALGIIILNSNKLDSDASFLTVTGSEVSASNSHQLLTAMSGAALYTDLSGDYKGFAARRVKKRYVTTYFIRVNNACYNHTNNYTWMTGSQGEIHPDFRASDGDPVTYITAIGLYNDRKELLAVAKPSKAIIKTCVSEALFKVNLRYE